LAVESQPTLVKNWSVWTIFASQFSSKWPRMLRFYFFIEINVTYSCSRALRTHLLFQLWLYLWASSFCTTSNNNKQKTFADLTIFFGRNFTKIKNFWTQFFVILSIHKHNLGPVRSQTSLDPIGSAVSTIIEYKTNKQTNKQTSMYKDIDYVVS